MLSRILLLAAALGLLACGGPASPIVPAPKEPIMSAWWLAERAGELALTLEQATARDQAITDATPQPDLWQEPGMPTKAGELYAALCASCHGPRGKGEGAPAFDNPPRDFGTFGLTMGFTMGGDAMRGGIFRKIKAASEGSMMPGFGSQLSNEQIWALVYFIEHL